jgi:hypothetical protein
MLEYQLILVLLALAVVAAGAAGGAAEPIAPKLRFPESWTTSGKDMGEATCLQRCMTGAIGGMLFLAFACNLSTVDLITVNALPPFTIAKVIGSFTCGVLIVRLFRLRISVPVSFLWTLLTTAIDQMKEKSPTAKSSAQVKKTTKRAKKERKHAVPQKAPA